MSRTTGSAGWARCFCHSYWHYYCSRCCAPSWTNRACREARIARSWAGDAAGMGSTGGMSRVSPLSFAGRLLSSCGRSRRRWLSRSRSRPGSAAVRLPLDQLRDRRRYRRSSRPGNIQRSGVPHWVRRGLVRAPRLGQARQEEDLLIASVARLDMPCEGTISRPPLRAPLSRRPPPARIVSQSRFQTRASILVVYRCIIIQTDFKVFSVHRLVLLCDMYARVTTIWLAYVYRGSPA